MGDIADLTVRVSMITDDFKKGAEEVKQKSEEVKKSTEGIQDAGASAGATGSKFKVVNQVFGSFSGNFKKSSNAIKGIAGAFKGAGGAAAGAGTAMLGAAGIAGIAAFAMVKGLKKVYEKVSELAAFASPQEFQETTASIKQASANFKQVIGTVATPIFQAMSGALKGMLEALTNVAFGLMQICTFVSEVMGLGNAFEGLSTSVDSATAGFASFDKVTTINDQDQYSADLTTITEMANRLKDAKRVASDIRQFFKDISSAWNSLGSNITSWWNSLGGVLGNAWGQFTSVMGNAWASISDFFGNIWGSLVSINDTIKSKILGVITTVVDGIKSLFAGLGIDIEGIFKGIVNVFIDTMNKVVNIYNSTLGNFRVDNDMLNIHFGLPKMAELPRLAQGGVVSPNMPFIVGDNTREKEAVAPLSSLQSMIDQAVKNAGGGVGSATIPVTVQLDGRTLARATYKYNTETAFYNSNAINGMTR